MRILIAPLAALLVSSPLFAETILIGTESDYAPIMFVDEDGILTGRDKDIGDEICARAGWECEWVQTEFTALIPGVAAGAFDLAIGGIAITPGRWEIVDFSDMYRPRTQNTSFFAGTKPNIDPAKSTIGVAEGTVLQSHLDGLGYDYVTYIDNSTALNALLADEIDLMFAGSLFLSDAVERGYTQLTPNGEEKVDDWGTGIAIRKGREDLLAELNAVIQTMWEDGTLNLLHERWVGTDTDA